MGRSSKRDLLPVLAIATLMIAGILAFLIAGTVAFLAVIDNGDARVIDNVDMPVTTNVETPVAPVEPPTSTDSVDFRYEHFTDTLWEGVLYGVVPVGFDESGEANGACYLIVGEVTPTFSTSGTTATAGSAPDFFLQASGLWGSGRECDSSEAETLGYRVSSELETQVGTTVRFFAAVHVPEDYGPVTALVIGCEGDGRLQGFEPVFVEHVP